MSREPFSLFHNDAFICLDSFSVLIHLYIAIVRKPPRELNTFMFQQNRILGEDLVAVKCI